MRKVVLVLAIGFTVLGAQAQSRLSDSQIVSRLVGCWKSPRVLYDIQCDGVMTSRWPVYPVPTNHTWAVRDGIFYQDGEPYQILVVDDWHFIYQSYGGRVIILFRVFNPLGSGGVVMRSSPESEQSWES